MNGFEDFWAAYPRKAGKLAAKREWDRIHPTPEVIQQIAAALAWQRETWDDPVYIPHPRTWLHQGRWMDEPARPIEAQPKPDMHGHVPPCRTRDECNRRHFEDVTGKRAQG